MPVGNSEKSFMLMLNKEPHLCVIRVFVARDSCFPLGWQTDIVLCRASTDEAGMLIAAVESNDPLLLSYASLMGWQPLHIDRYLHNLTHIEAWHTQCDNVYLVIAKECVMPHMPMLRDKCQEIMNLFQKCQKYIHEPFFNFSTPQRFFNTIANPVIMVSQCVCSL